jgi:hypothetical protein
MKTREFPVSESRDSITFDEGRAKAAADISAGMLRYRRHGHPGPWGQDFVDLMAQRLGVPVEDTAGCVVTSQLVAFDEGYNEVVLQEIARKHGPDAFASLVSEAMAAAKARYDSYFAGNKTDGTPNT